jgi:uncharacterized protein YtpQ (UPF0354 family)
MTISGEFLGNLLFVSHSRLKQYNAMFNFFKKKQSNIDRTMPDFYKEIINQKEYDVILDFAIGSLKDIGEIKSIGEGTIMLKNPADESKDMQFHLDNLVRKCKSHDRHDWQTIIDDHFKRCLINPNKAKYIYKDFDYACEFIKFAVRPKSMFQNIEDFVYRIDIPETCTFLILDYDDAFHYVRREDIKEWEKSEKELFEIAFNNISTEELDIKGLLWKETFEVISFFSSDFSASYIVDLGHNAAFTIGEYGSVVCIPSKGTAFAHPLNGNTAIPFIASFDELMNQFFNNDEVPITNHYYWYYEGIYEIFPEKIKNGHKHIVLPPNLEQLFI